MRRKRHSKKEVELALQYAENHGKQIKRIVDNCRHVKVKMRRVEK
jgi:hypothetical protein